MQSEGAVPYRYNQLRQVLADNWLPCQLQLQHACLQELVTIAQELSSPIPKSQHPNDSTYLINPQLNSLEVFTLKRVSLQHKLLISSSDAVYDHTVHTVFSLFLGQTAHDTLC